MTVHTYIKTGLRPLVATLPLRLQRIWDIAMCPLPMSSEFTPCIACGHSDGSEVQCFVCLQSWHDYCASIFARDNIVPAACRQAPQPIQIPEHFDSGRACAACHSMMRLGSAQLSSSFFTCISSLTHTRTHMQFFFTCIYYHYYYHY